MSDTKNIENKEGTKEEAPKTESTNTENKETKIDNQLSVDDAKNEFQLEEGKTYTYDEAMKILNNGIKKGHNIAKNQLNKDITKYKDEVTNLKTEKEQLTTKLTELEKTAETTVADKQKKDKEKSDIEKQLEETNKKLKVMEDKAVEAVTQVQELKEENKKDKLLAKRMELIKNANGRIVESSVKGNTIEELEQSAKDAQAEYEKIENEMKKKFNIPEKTEEIDNKPKEPIAVKRINPQNANETKDWKTKSDEIKAQIYRDAGFPV